MPANSILPDNPQRISVVCNCGKKLIANSMQSGKRSKCPSCGQIIVVPPLRAVSVPAPAKAAPEPRPATSNRRLMTVLWSLPVVVAIGGGVFIYFEEQWRQQAQIDAAQTANTEVGEAVQAADRWLKQGSSQDGENVEHRLREAIAANDVSEKANADAVLETVRTRRAELAADAIFDLAKTKLEAQAIVEAVALLHRYIDDPRATNKPAAEQLLAACKLATSENAALQTLMAISDEEFAEFSNTGKLDGRETTPPILAEIRATTLRQKLATANQRREENKIAEATRQEEENKIAEATRQESERLALAADEAKAATDQAADDPQKDQPNEGVAEADVAGVWIYTRGARVVQEITLLRNGKINDPDGQDSWTLKGKTLEMRWGDLWIDTCIVSDDGTAYRGANQQTMLITGRKKPTNDAIAEKKQLPIKALKLIRGQLVGDWSLGSDSNRSIRFFANETFVETGPNGRKEVARGRWTLEQDGNIRISGNTNFPINAKMDPDGIKVYLEDTTGTRPMETLARIGGIPKHHVSSGYTSPWEQWRKAHPAEASIEIQKAAAQTRESQKNVDKGWSIASQFEQQKEKERLRREERKRAR